MRPNLGRLSTFESRCVAWCDAVRVLIRVLQSGRDPSLVTDARPHDYPHVVNTRGDLDRLRPIMRG